jgi:hypothetical protein
MSTPENANADAESQSKETLPSDSDAQIREWLNIRKKAGLKIVPSTAHVNFVWTQVDDPYGIFPAPPEEGVCIGRVYFARSPDSDIWVEFGDLPEKTRQEIERMLDSGHVFDEDLPFD